MRRLAKVSNETEGSALLEFAIVLPLLVVFIVGIYDFITHGSQGFIMQRVVVNHSMNTHCVHS